MSVIITDSCICCDACLDECPVEAIVEDDDNPTGEDIYYVYPDQCVECVGFGDEIPKCAEACPTEECIIWGPDHNGIANADRKANKPVIEE